MSAEITYTHEGERYRLGYGAAFYGIWDIHESDEAPVRTFPRTNEGWEFAWAEFAALEDAAEPLAEPSAASAGPLPPETPPTEQAQAAPPQGVTQTKPEVPPSDRGRPGPRRKVAIALIATLVVGAGWAIIATANDPPLPGERTTGPESGTGERTTGPESGTGGGGETGGADPIISEIVLAEGEVVVPVPDSWEIQEQETEFLKLWSPASDWVDLWLESAQEGATASEFVSATARDTLLATNGENYSEVEILPPSPLSPSGTVSSDSYAFYTAVWTEGETSTDVQGYFEALVKPSGRTLVVWVEASEAFDGIVSRTESVVNPARDSFSRA